MPRSPERSAASSPRALAGLLPFLRPYRGRIALAGLFLVLAATTTLLFPVALKSLIDQGIVAADPGERVMALRTHFLELFAVGAALGVFSALRFLPDRGYGFSVRPLPSSISQPPVGVAG